MASLLLAVFILQLVLHIINTVGASTINDLVLPLLFAAVPVMFE
jgi:hypothetical protein